MTQDIGHEERNRRVQEAYDTLLAGGFKPTQDRVLAYLAKNYGQAVSLRDLSPMLRYLNTKRTSAAAVAKVVRAYVALDLVQREAAMAMMQAAELRMDLVNTTPAPRIGNMQELEGGAA
jgi:exopolyphosphatase/pppGpp-phosphohydrolase